MNLVNLANLIPSEAEPLVLELVERLGKLRAHPDDESLLIETIVRKQRRRSPTFTHQWTRAEDRELLRIQHRPRGVIEFASRIGVSEKSARRRLEKLRDKGRCTRPAREIEG